MEIVLSGCVEANVISGTRTWWKDIMLARRVHAFYFTLIALRSHLVISQEHSAKFQLADDVRYECGGLYTLRSRSLSECALVCATEGRCSAFNFGSGHCELLSSAASCRTSASGWTHGSSLGKSIKHTSPTPHNGLVWGFTV